jgi:hypothetical protein
MSREPVSKKKASKATPVVKTARVSHPDALERLKNAYLAGQSASAELEREVETDYRETYQHSPAPTPLEIVLEIANLTDEEREKLQRLKDGIVIPVPEGGLGHPVGPQGEAEAQAMQTRRPGDVVPESTNVPATEQVPSPPARFANEKAKIAGPKAGTKDFGKETPESKLKRVGAKGSKAKEAKRSHSKKK